jgi:hypothetical protein
MHYENRVKWTGIFDGLNKHEEPGGQNNTRPMIWRHQKTTIIQAYIIFH